VYWAHKIGCHDNVPCGSGILTLDHSSAGHSSTNPENLVKIGPVDAEIIDWTEIVKNKNK